MRYSKYTTKHHTLIHTCRERGCVVHLGAALAVKVLVLVKRQIVMRQPWDNMGES